MEIYDRWFEAQSLHGDLDGVTLDAWTAQLQLVLQRFKEVNRLSLQTRRNVLDMIRSKRGQAELDRLTPSSKADTSAKIDWLERNLFNGRSYEPIDKDTKFAEDDGPFGMVIKADQQSKIVDISNLDDDHEVLNIDHNGNDWTLDPQAYPDCSFLRRRFLMH